MLQKIISYRKKHRVICYVSSKVRVGHYGWRIYPRDWEVLWQLQKYSIYESKIFISKMSPELKSDTMNTN